MDECIVVWCDSTQGLISTRVTEAGLPVRYRMDDMSPEVAPVCRTPNQVFDILKRRDGTMVSIPVTSVSYILGWSV